MHEYAWLSDRYGQKFFCTDGRKATMHVCLLSVEGSIGATSC